MSSNVTYSQQAPGATGVDPNHPATAKFRIVDAENGIIEPVDGVWRKKFAVCGFAASSRDLAPFADPEYYVTGMNQLYRHIPRADFWWDIHANWRVDNVEGTDHPGYLAQCGMPVFMSALEPTIPTSVNFPLQEVMDHVVGMDYFTSTVAFMLSWTILQIDKQVDVEVDALHKTANIEAETGVVLSNEDANRRAEAQKILANPRAFRNWLRARYQEREIAIFGIDLIVGTEYDWQKSCVEYILGLAEARGITLRLPPACALLKQRWRYGYQTDTQGTLVSLVELQKRQQALEAQRAQLVAQLQTLDGALQQNSYWEQVASLRSRGGAVRLNETS